MKAYEAWLKPQKLLYDVRAKEGWRAAMEQVQAWLDNLGFDDSYLEIGRELEEEK